MNKALYYWHGPNFGDELNTILFEELFNARLRYTTSIADADYMAIGSNLDALIPANMIPLRRVYHYINNKKSKLVILGSGLKKIPPCAIFLRRTDFRMVRGKLTERTLRENGLIREDIVTGDPGLLASRLVIEKPVKEYALGLIPHLSDLNSVIFYEIYKKYAPFCIIINVQDPPRKVLREMARCERIVSSSLHGLIVADSLNIPNLWVYNAYKWNKSESRFKYDDYYSVFDMPDYNPLETADFLAREKSAGLKYIETNYRVPAGQVRAKQEELYAFLKDVFAPPP